MTTHSSLPRSTPEAQGVSSVAISKLIDALDQIEYMNSLMLVRHGHVIAEGWWSPYAAQSPHMLFSLSKSFTSTAIGMLVAEGKLSVDDFVLSFFPADAPPDPSDNLKAMRVRHLLSMSTGHAEDTLGPHLRETKNWARAILAQPVTYAPGTHFVYNSGATYVLSAIAQRLTGQRLLHYLTPRLFEPLGIVGATWQQCPLGIDTGGWGLSIRTEDIAKFGQLYLQKGVWQGQRLLSEAWVSEATSKHISNANPDDPNAPLDWQQGYGYQFWRCQHNAYRGDGAFGQYCVVLPDQDAVLAITSGVKNMQQVLDIVWENLLPSLAQTPLPYGERLGEGVPHKLRHLALTPQPGHAFSPVASRVSGRRYAIEPNARGITAMTFVFHNGRCTLTVGDAHGEHPIACGYRGWLQGATTFQSDDKPHAPYAASGAWAADDVYDIKLFYTETPFMNTLQCTFNDRELSAVLSSYVAFGPNEPIHLKGHIKP